MHGIEKSLLLFEIFLEQYGILLRICFSLFQKEKLQLKF
jgi:hypothetical protein